MFIDTDFPPGGDRPAMLLRVVAAFERNEIEAAVDGFIALLDARDGDVDMEDDDRAAAVMSYAGRDPDYDEEPLLAPDGLAGDPTDAEDEGHLELSGDERDASFPEANWGIGSAPFIPSDMASALYSEDAEDCDPAEPAGDEQGDQAWIEWHTRGRHRHHTPVSRDGVVLQEDDEDDDADTGIEDDPKGCDPEEDKGIDDERHDGEDSDEPDDRESRLARRPHRIRIRRTRCDKVVYPANRWTGRQCVVYRVRNRGGARVTMGSAL